MRYLVFAVVAGLFPAVSFAEEARPSLSLTGQATVSVEPDEAYITIGIDTKSMDASKAIQTNNANMEGLYATLGEFKINKKNIQTLSFAFNKSYRVEKLDEQGNTRQVFDGYVVNNVVRITVCDYAEILGKLITRVAKEGSDKITDTVTSPDVPVAPIVPFQPNRDTRKFREDPPDNSSGRPSITPVEPNVAPQSVPHGTQSFVTIADIAFGSSKSKEKLDEARAEAIKDANTKAAMYAKNGGFKIVKLLHVSEGYVGIPRAEMAYSRSMATADSTPVSGGSLSYSMSVSCSWEIASVNGAE